MGLFWVVIAIIIISTVVGAVAKLLNNLNEMNNAPRNNPNRPPARAGGGGGGVVRQSSSDMDRFLAEIDRLRKKNAEAPPQPAGQATPVAPVVQPTKSPERPKPRVMAELAEAAPRPTDTGFNPPASLTTSPVPTAAPVHKTVDLPVATVVTPPSGTGAPATKVTRIAGRARPAAKTPFAKNLTTLLGSGQGLALAIVLGEVLGPPRSKKGS